MMHPQKAGLHGFFNMKSLYRMPLTIIYFKGIFPSTSGEEKEMCGSGALNINIVRVLILLHGDKYLRRDMSLHHERNCEPSQGEQAPLGGGRRQKTSNPTEQTHKHVVVE